MFSEREDLQKIRDDLAAKHGLSPHYVMARILAMLWYQWKTTEWNREMDEAFAVIAHVIVDPIQDRFFSDDLYLAVKDLDLSHD